MKREAAFVLLVLSVGTATAGPAEDTAFAAFENFCLLIPEAVFDSSLTGAGAVRVPPDKEDVFLTPHKGRAFYLPASPGAVIVSRTDKGACSVYEPNASGAAVDWMVKTRLRNIPAFQNSEGSQEQHYYAVTFGPSNAHFFIATRISTLATVAGTQLTAIPEESLNALGVRGRPAWPK